MARRVEDAPLCYIGLPPAGRVAAKILTHSVFALAHSTTMRCAQLLVEQAFLPATKSTINW